jgi:hypothetical protein
MENTGEKRDGSEYRFRERENQTPEDTVLISSVNHSRFGHLIRNSPEESLHDQNMIKVEQMGQNIHKKIVYQT